MVIDNNTIRLSTSDIYAENHGEQVMIENITHWMPTNMPFYPATK